MVMFFLKYFKIHFILVLMASIISSAQLHAASLQVSPILIEFTKNEKAKELWLINTGSTDLRAQVRVQDWTQQDGQENLSPSQALVASPMVTRVKAGGRQLVRLIKRSPNDVNQEQAFRIIINELPQENVDQQKVNLNVLLQYSIPAFYKSQNPRKTLKGISSLKDIQFKFEKNTLVVTNSSSSYLRLSQLTYVDKSGNTTDVVPGLLGYVLAGQTMSWLVSKDLHLDEHGTFKAVVNSDLNEQTLPLTK